MNKFQDSLRSIDLVIFDCDGVIADSEVLAIRALTQHLVALGIDLEEGFVATHIVGKSFSAVKKVVKNRLNFNLPRDFEDRYWASLALDFDKKLQQTPGFLEVLNAINVPFCLASNSNQERVQRTLDVLGFQTEFGQNVFTASQVVNGKPAPDLHVFAAKNMGTTPERVLVIEDSATGIEAALSAGMYVWRYVGASHFSASQRTGLLDTSEVPVFDSWSRFFELAPELKR